LLMHDLVGVWLLPLAARGHTLQGIFPNNAGDLSQVSLVKINTKTGGEKMQLLEGVRIIDLTRVLAGPFCTMLLADMGAEVIKVERPLQGDDARAFGPFLNDFSMYFLSINRNKKSITIDLKTEKGKNILKDLVKEADVLVENFRPGTMEKLGLGYDVLQSLNSRLIYAACSGFGHSGPYSERPAYDLIVQGLSGIMSVTGFPDGPPTKVGSSIADITAGLFTAIGILSALNYRNRTGMGQKVDVAMLDSQVAILENALARYFVNSEPPKPIGNRHPSITPFAVFDTKDDYIIIAVGNDTMWKNFCSLIQRSDLASAPKFLTNRLRTENYEELFSILGEELKKKTTAEWLEIFGQRIPCGPINNIQQVVNNPQVIAREMIQEVDQPGIGKVKVPGNPIKFSESPITNYGAAPVLGQDNEVILKDYLNLSTDEIKQLEEEKII
jgi:CoA:oxalate CoA-transferase